MAKQAQSSNTFASTLEIASGTGVYEWHAAEDRLIWSPGLLQMYGLDETPASEGGFIRLVHPEDRIRVEAETAGFLGTKADSFSHEFRIVRPDNSVRYILDRGMIERDRQGRVLTIRGMNIDLTDCIRAGGRDVGAPADRGAFQSAQAETEGRLITALRAGRVGVHEYHPRSGVMVWDGVIREIWGITADEDVTYDTFLAGVHPDDRASMQAAVDAALDSDGPGRYDAIYRVVHRQSGQIRWVRADGDITFDGRTAVKLIGTVRDITVRKKAEAALRESEERFRHMADNAPVMIWVTEADGSCTYLNRYWFEFTGQTAKDASGFGWLKAVHPDDAAQAERIFRKATERREAFRIDYRLRCADGRYRWAVDSARPRLNADGDFLGFIGSVLDVHDFRDAEQKLRAAHQTFQQLVELSPFGIYAVDSDFRLVQASQGARKAFASVNPLIGRDFAEVMRAIWPETFAAEVIARFRQTLATGEPYHAPSTVEQRTDSGTTEEYDWKLEQITMPDGRPGVVCHFYDLSERHAFEDKIQFLMREVTHRSKNLLALVGAVARQTASVGGSDFLERFDERLSALAASQDLLLSTEWDGADLTALIEAQLLPFKDLVGNRIVIDGPVLHVSPAAAQTLGMALHELATNAAKYGALSNEVGLVDIGWQVEDEAGQQQFAMAWTERDGPQVKPPTRSGFGERVAKRMVGTSLAGDVSLEYPATGVRWSLRCQLAAVCGNG